MKTLDKQAVFDKVVTHLLTQKKPATAAAGSCVYRTADGLSCAIGCLIPDELYDTAMEGLGVADLAVDGWMRNALLQALHVDSLTNDDLFFLSTLQIVHDDYNEEEWYDELCRVASDYGLYVNLPAND